MVVEAVEDGDERRARASSWAEAVDGCARLIRDLRWLC